MRQRRALHRGAVVFTGAAARPRAPMESAGGAVRARVREDGLVSVDMGVPNFDPRSLPMDAPAEMPPSPLDVDGESVEFGAVSMGNPHVVLCGARCESRTAWIALGPGSTPRALSTGAPTWGSCKSWIAAHIDCGCSSGESARRWPAARVPAPPWRSGECRGLLDADVRVDLPGGTARVLGRVSDSPCG